MLLELFNLILAWQLLSGNVAAAQDIRTLVAASGDVSTPNYPSPYPNTDSEITWNLNLSPYEEIVVTRAQTTPAFRPSDKFVVKLDDREEYQLGTDYNANKWSMVARDKPKKVAFFFKSHHDRTRNDYWYIHNYGYTSRNSRQQAHYDIKCARGIIDGKPNLPFGCVYGQCSIDRSSTRAKPVKCSCPSGYFGERCERMVYDTDFVHLSNLQGEISTPNFPKEYDLRKNITWILQLAPYAKVDIIQLGDHGPNFEECCDSFTLMTDKREVFNFKKATQKSGHETLHTVEASSSGQQVEVRFSSDGLIAGTGYQIGYHIKCGDLLNGNESIPWCFNGGNCSMAEEATMLTAAKQVPTCTCSKNFEGLRCNSTIQPTQTDITLTEPKGYFETPNYPQSYSPLTNVTWSLALQHFEFANFEASERALPDFEQCCDSLKLNVNGLESYDFASASGQPAGSTLITVIADHGPVTVEIQFTSDGGVSGKGFRGRYSIGCISGRKEDHENACFNRGTCSVQRNETWVDRVQCSCEGTGFSGARCKIPEAYKISQTEFQRPTGILATPAGYYPKDQYAKATNFTWSWKLQPLEIFSLKKISTEPAGFETCCDFLTLRVNGSFQQEFNEDADGGPHVMTTLQAGQGITDVTLEFLSDGGVNGLGLQMEYAIQCEPSLIGPSDLLENSTALDFAPYCLNSAKCSVSRNGSTVHGIQCFCPKDYEGSRCEKPMKRSEKRINLNAAEGVFETPGYPGNYPDGVTVTWEINLQAHEKITFVNVGSHKPDFESCCDFFDLIVDGRKISDFTSHGSGTPGEVLSSVAATEGPKKVELKFHSDGGVNGMGLKGEYKIVCLQEEKSARNDSKFEICLNDGKCKLDRNKERSGPVYCTCAEHYTGPRCERVAHVCPLNCGAKATCEWERNKFSCHCVSGFVHSGKDCVDIDECQSHPCHDPWVCVNQPGSYSCKCPTDKAGFQEVTGRSGKRVCAHSGCSSPWVYNTKKNGCLLLSSEGTLDEDSAALYCKSHEASLAQVLSEEDNNILGLASKYPLVWLGLTDQQSERDWQWKDTNVKPAFTSWGPGFPAGQGDFAVSYPNRWILGECELKKRFICEASEPYCPSDWTRLEDGRGQKCYYQSTYELDFVSAAKRCQLLALGGHLAKWSRKTSLFFTPNLWDTTEAQGLAHFWIGIGKCEENDGSTRASTDKLGMVEKTKNRQYIPYETKETRTWLDFLAPEIIQNEDTALLNSLCPAGERLTSCAFLYPNAWADYTAKDKTKAQFPSVACARPTTSSFREDKFKSDEIKDGLAVFWEGSGYPTSSTDRYLPESWVTEHSLEGAESEHHLLREGEPNDRIQPGTTVGPQISHTAEEDGSGHGSGVTTSSLGLKINQYHMQDAQSGSGSAGLGAEFQ